jgi:hypothetical protein
MAVVVPSVIAVAISAKHHCQGMSVKKHFQLHPLKETLPFWWCTVSSVSYQEELYTTYMLPSQRFKAVDFYILL